jgi:LemA protein
VIDIFFVISDNVMRPKIIYIIFYKNKMEILFMCCGGIFCIFGGIVVALIGYVILTYNNLKQQNVLVDEGWSGIDVQLKKRFDLIPNLVETVKGYAKHEDQIFTKVAELRSGMINTNDPKELSAMEGELRSTLKTLFAVAENYPELKANENFMKLQSSLQEIETDLEKSRRYYNGAVRDLNRMIVVFPANIVANFFKIKHREFFEIENDEERKNVSVKF